MRQVASQIKSRTAVHWLRARTEFAPALASGECSERGLSLRHKQTPRTLGVQKQGLGAAQSSSPTMSMMMTRELGSSSSGSSSSGGHIGTYSGR